jgi:hypothetical protein
LFLHSFDIDKDATKLTQDESVIKAIEASSAITPSPIEKFHDHLRQKEPVYARLMELKKKVFPFLGKSPVDTEAEKLNRGGRIQRETNTSSSKDREPILLPGKLQQNSTE